MLPPLGSQTAIQQENIECDTCSFLCFVASFNYGLSFSLFVMSLNVSPCVFVRRYLSVSPFGMNVLTFLGWCEVLWMYNCLLVGFMCVFFTSRRPLSGPLYTITTKNVNSFLSCEFDHGVDFVDVCDECVELFVCACPY